MTRRLWAASIALVLVAVQPAHAEERALRIGMPGGINSIVYYHESQPGTAILTHAVFDTLLAYDERRQAYQPLLAKTWRRVDDRTLDFDLRTDVKWHDGVALDADDVVYTLNWLGDTRTRLHMQHQRDGLSCVAIPRRHVSAAPWPFFPASQSAGSV